MTVLIKDKIDIIYYRNKSFYMVIAFDLKWNKRNVVVLGKKIERYLMAIKNKEVYSVYPAALKKIPNIEVVAKYPPDDKACLVLEHFKEVVNKFGVGFSYETFNPTKI